MVMPGGGGNSLGTAQGRITIDVSNVQQAAQMVKQAAAEMTAAFNTMNQAARAAATGVNQVATAGRQMNQAARTAANSAASATRSASQAAKQNADRLSRSIRQNLVDLTTLDRSMSNRRFRPGTGAAPGIDVSAIKNAGVQVKAVETQVNTSMASMKRSTESFGRSLQRLGGQFFVFSVAAGVLAAAGLRTANTMEAMQIRFTALEGSSEAAEARIAGLTEEARRFNLPLTEVLAGIARLQPLLKQTGNETNRFVGLVARLATINPVQGAEGAAIAIGEALSGTGNDFYSLQERFNIPRNLIRQAIAESDNFADALDSVLNQLGATNDVAIQFGNTFQGAFRAAKDEFLRLIGEGLKPLMKAVTPIIRAFADVAAKINDSSPFLATMLSTTLLITAAMAPLLYAVGKFAELWKTAASNARATALAQKGLRVAGAGIAAAAGLEIGQGIYGAITGESQESIQNRLGEFFAQTTALILAGIEQVLTAVIAPFQILANVVSLVSSHLRSFVASAQKVAADLMLIGNTDPESRARLEARGAEASETVLREFLAQGFGTPIQALAGRVLLRDPSRGGNAAQLAVGQALIGDFDQLRMVMELTAEQTNAIRVAFLELVNDGVDPYIALGKMLDGLNVPQNFNQIARGIQMPNFGERAFQFYNNITGKGSSSGDGATGAPVSATGFNTAQIDAFRQFKDEMATLERDYNENVLKETQQYHTRRNDIILEYNEKVVQAQEDEFRRRTEAEQDLAREIADLQEDSAKDQVKARRDLEAEIAKLMRESRLRVLEAASRLDARAVFEEQRRTRARIDEMRGEYDEEAQERKRQTDERIKDLQDEFKREEDKRAQDFQRRLAELDRQKNRELQQLQQQHYNRLSEMQSQYARERNARNQAFVTELNDLAGHNGRVLTIHRTGMFTLEYELLAWYSRMQQQLAGGGAPRIVQPIPFPGRPAPTPYQTGTSYVPATDIYKLHAGEGVMTPSVNALARSILGGNYSQSQLAGLMTGRGGGRGQSFDFSGMQIVLGDVGNRSNADVAAMIEDGLYQFFSRATVQARVAVA